MKIYLILLTFCFNYSLIAQELSAKQLEKFQKAEQALLPFVNNFANDSLSFEQRVSNIHDFIPRFVAILKEKNSYLYPFESLASVAKVTAPDNAFKVYTWELKEPLGTHRYYGAIQLNSENLILKPLFDFSDTLDYHTQKILAPNNWYGCLYYNCVLTKNTNGTKYYTLFGLDKADFVSNRKILEIMQIEPDGNIVFGKEPLIAFHDSTGALVETKNRLFLEYTDKASLSLNYNAEKQMIIHDHITAPSEKERDAEFSYVPDGTYEGLQWKKNKWEWVYRVFTYSIDENDAPPMPFPQNDKEKKNIFGQ